MAVLPDEHGEAQVEYDPYPGFYFDSVGGDPERQPRLRPAGRRRARPVGHLGQGHVPVPAGRRPGKLSGEVNKTVHNLFDKSLSYYPKGAGAENANARILVAHGQESMVAALG